jgi:glycosyltransferase involved in cell wall biosynthesis
LTPAKPRLLILIVAYNAEQRIATVLGRIPPQLSAEYDVEVLVLDDSSRDQTFEASRQVQQNGTIPFPLHVLFNPVNQGYGGNQKIGYHFAIEHGFDYVALVHGDGQYAPECLPDLVRPLRTGAADAVFGSRMLERAAALKGGMPLYKYVGNKILTHFQNWMLGTNLSEFHSGYRIYAVAALKRVPFELNTNDFHFDTEIIVQFVTAGLRIAELPIPTYYGDEICHVNGLRYAANVTRSVIVARCLKLGVFYDRRFDCAVDEPNYREKLDFVSPHTLAIDAIPAGSRVLDLGCADGYVGVALRRHGCRVTGVDRQALPSGIELDEFIRHDLNRGLPDVDMTKYDFVLLLDVIEHLQSPEAFVEELRNALGRSPSTTVIASTANVGFAVVRLMLLFGQFNYGKRGILDLTHARLFTFSSFRRLWEQAGFAVESERGVPGPFALAFGRGAPSRIALAANAALIRLSRRLFSYQMLIVAKPLPSLEYLLCEAREQSAVRASSDQTSVGAS